MSLAILLFSLPHVFLDEYLPVDNNDSNVAVAASKSNRSSKWAFFLVAMALIASAAYLPLWTTGKIRN